MQRSYLFETIIASIFIFAGCNQTAIELHPVQELFSNADGTGMDSPASRGKLQAKQDIANSNLEYKVYGTPAEWAHHFYDTLETDYNVKVDHVAGCIVTEDICLYADAYNEIVESEIKRLHGDDTFDRVDAIALRKQRQEESKEAATSRGKW